MDAMRRRLRACTWLALVAMALIALGPTISRLTLPEVAAPMAMDHAAMRHAAMHDRVDGDALALADSSATPAGHHKHHYPPAAKSPPPPAPPAHTHTLEHCSLCVVALFAFAVAPPPPSVVTPAVAPLPIALPRDGGISPGRDTWSPIGSRGPPALA
jgi:hypothetical protein